MLPPDIFKAYDIRGIVGKTLTAPIVHAVGQALGSLAQERERDTLAVGRDGRLSGPELAGALAEGIRASGANVIDIGMVTTPMSYFAAHHLATHCCVAVTGSHNPPDYNGLKMVIAGDTLAGADIQALKTRIEAGNLKHGAGSYRICRAYRGRREARATSENRGRLRQRRRGSFCAEAIFATRLHGNRALLRRGRDVPEPSP